MFCITAKTENEGLQSRTNLLHPTLIKRKLIATSCRNISGSSQWLFRILQKMRKEERRAGLCPFIFSKLTHWKMSLTVTKQKNPPDKAKTKMQEHWNIGNLPRTSRPRPAVVCLYKAARHSRLLTRLLASFAGFRRTK